MSNPIPKEPLPFKVVKHAGSKGESHRTETRYFEQKYRMESFCDEPGCKFYGKHAAQGVCYGKDSYGDMDSRHLDKIWKYCEEWLDEDKKSKLKNGIKSQKAWVEHLEGALVCARVNECFTLNELIYLRAQNAKLRLQLGKYK